MNVYADVKHLQKSPVETGGLCDLNAIVAFKKEDVLTWPSIDPVTSIIKTSIVMKPDKSMYTIQAADTGRQFSQERKYDGRGPYYDIEVNGILAGGTNTANILSVDVMAHHEWGLIVKDRAGFYRLIGNADKGAKFFDNYDSGDRSKSRKHEIKFVWSYAGTAPVYQSSLFNITINGVTITVGNLEWIMRFKVGAPGAPMDDTDTTLTDVRFKNKYLLVLVDGVAIPVDDGLGSIDWTGSIIRHIEKTFAGDTITWIGGVVNGEIVEIYAFD